MASATLSFALTGDSEEVTTGTHQCLLLHWARVLQVVWVLHELRWNWKPKLGTLAWPVPTASGLHQRGGRWGCCMSSCVQLGCGGWGRCAAARQGVCEHPSNRKCWRSRWTTNWKGNKVEITESVNPPTICVEIESEIKLSAAEKKKALIFSNPTLRWVQAAY